MTQAEVFQERQVQRGLCVCVGGKRQRFHAPGTLDSIAMRVYGFSFLSVRVLQGLIFL